jgi:hypothetical protein
LALALKLRVKGNKHALDAFSQALTKIARVEAITPCLSNSENNEYHRFVSIELSEAQ